MTARSRPAAGWRKALAVPSFRSHARTRETDRLRATNGSPRPKLYAARSCTPRLSWAVLPATVRMAARTGPMQGVHVMAKAASNGGAVQRRPPCSPAAEVAAPAEPADPSLQKHGQAHCEDQDAGDSSQRKSVGQQQRAKL